MDRPSVYLETTVPSYLAAEPSRDLVVAGHQQTTREWWQTARVRFDLCISEYVLDEIAAGDPIVAAKRLAFVETLTVLNANDEVHALADLYSRRLGLSGKALFDVPHFAFAVAYKIEYLVTWNCSHIANGMVIRRLNAVNMELGRFCPAIVTPDELMDSIV